MADETRVIIPVRAPVVDERGEILNLIDAPFMSAAVIRSKKGAIRGNHYHKTDYHYCWLQRGGMVYLHRPVGANEPPGRWTIKPGQLFYTPPMYEHAMHFTEDSILLVFARNNREMPNYEADTVRVLPIE
jgi:dTDP-4-dehydrorhamnose 3,5-epimerase-like enzyme